MHQSEFHTANVALSRATATLRKQADRQFQVKITKLSVDGLS